VLPAKLGGLSGHQTASTLTKIYEATFIRAHDTIARGRFIDRGSWTAFASAYIRGGQAFSAPPARMVQSGNSTFYAFIFVFWSGAGALLHAWE